jgi:glycosyltransferase involved in cell wall biosynthesis
MNETPFSVLLTTYRGDEPQELDAALESTVNQTYPPEEIVLVEDGPLTDELRSVVDAHVSDHPDLFLVRQLPENKGRGTAAGIGLECCSYDLVGIMAADDINISDRYERQVKYLKDNPDIDVVGGYVEEFIENPDDPVATRKVPTEPSEVRRFALSRNPMTEVTVMFRKSSIMDVGGYRGVDRMEDYDLWVRLVVNGGALANIPEVLVKVRAGPDFSDRRGGVEYAREEIRQQLDFYEWGFISWYRALFNIITRVTLRVVPGSIRSLIYRKFARS